MECGSVRDTEGAQDQAMGSMWQVSDHDAIYRSPHSCHAERFGSQEFFQNGTFGARLENRIYRIYNNCA